jgi:hypothetical protein
MAEKDAHFPTCSLRDAQRWWAADQMLGWANRAHRSDGEGFICVECGGLLEPEAAAGALPTSGQVRALRDELEARGQSHVGYGALVRELKARGLNASKSTVKRRLRP